MNMNLPLPLANVAKVIVGNLSEAERQEFTAAINQAAEGKDLSLVHWAFLGSELRALSVELPKHIQVVIDSVIAGMDRLAAGRAWPEANEVAHTAYAAHSTANALCGDAKVIYATKAVAKAASLSSRYVINADEDAADAADAAAKAGGCYAEARCRQQDTLLALVKGAPAE